MVLHLDDIYTKVLQLGGAIAFADNSLEPREALPLLGDEQEKLIRALIRLHMPAVAHALHVWIEDVAEEYWAGSDERIVYTLRLSRLFPLSLLSQVAEAMENMVAYRVLAELYRSTDEVLCTRYVSLADEYAHKGSALMRGRLAGSYRLTPHYKA